MMNRDQRVLPQGISNVRAITNDEGGIVTIDGKGIVFGQRSQNLGGFYEYIDTGALNGADTEEMKSYYNHNADYTLGTLRNRTVELIVTDGSADYKITPPTGPIISEIVLAPILRGDVTGSSFMFDIADGGDYWEKGVDGIYIRYVRKISYLYEMGPVSMPAYTQTSTGVAKRSLDQFIAQVKAQEKEAVHYRRLNAERRLRLF